MFALKLLLCAVVVATLSLTAVVCYGTFEPAVKEFEKIESYLIKKVPNDNVASNLQAARAMLEKKAHKLIKNKPLIEALKEFTRVDEIQGVATCDNGKGKELLKWIDSSLAYDAARMINKPMSRLEKIAQFYAVRFVEFCWEQNQFVFELKTIFKQADYDILDAHLKTKVSTGDVEANLDEAMKMLTAAPEGSHMEEALKQFVALKQLYDQNTCNYYGHQIAFKNKLAIRGTFKNKTPQRRIDRVILEAIHKHDLICNGEYRKNYKAVITHLDPSVAQTVRSLANNHLERFFKSIEFMSILPGGSLVEDQADSQDLSKAILKRSIGEDMVEAARKTVETLAGGSEDEITCKAFGNDKKKIINTAVLGECYEKYLMVPCKAFMSKIAKDIFLPQFYAGDDEFAALPNTDDEESVLSYNHGRIGSLICLRLIKNKRWLYNHLAKGELQRQ